MSGYLVMPAESTPIRLWDHWGVTIKLDDIPEYVAYAEARDRYEKLSALRRLLAFRRRADLAIRWNLAQGAILDALLDGAGEGDG